MAPIRRYLRISRYSVLECRIYLDNPALAETWLLNPRDPVLPRVIESVRPLVLPKLREERERSKSKGKKKGVKDVVVTDDFEVSIFLTETSTRHSLLTKQKHFREPNKKGIQSNSNKLTGSTDNTPIDVDMPMIRREVSEEESLNLQDLPALDDDSNSLFVSDDEDTRRPKTRRANGDSPVTSPRPQQRTMGGEDQDGDKKKMAMETSYDGFAIYGRVLCLVVKRRDKKGKGPAQAVTGGQARMEEWITSTQMPPEEL